MLIFVLPNSSVIRSSQTSSTLVALSAPWLHSDGGLASGLRALSSRNVLDLSKERRGPLGRLSPGRLFTAASSTAAGSPLAVVGREPSPLLSPRLAALTMLLSPRPKLPEPAILPSAKLPFLRTSDLGCTPAFEIQYWAKEANCFLPAAACTEDMNACHSSLDTFPSPFSSAKVLRLAVMSLMPSATSPLQIMIVRARRNSFWSRSPFRSLSNSLNSSALSFLHSGSSWYIPFWS
mmetsp:Transcript_56292/g.163225  ORF Transcript_56292/g.163225 Transcript_56292/m.163225 type:complete len:235 (+) Transcript_56292:1354-2058(+)